MFGLILHGECLFADRIRLLALAHDDTAVGDLQTMRSSPFLLDSSLGSHNHGDSNRVTIPSARPSIRQLFNNHETSALVDEQISEELLTIVKSPVVYHVMSELFEIAPGKLLELRAVCIHKKSSKTGLRAEFRGSVLPELTWPIKVSSSSKDFSQRDIRQTEASQ
jgi:hypothetical protein